MKRKCANYISYEKLPDFNNKENESESESESDIDTEDPDDEYQCNYSFICIEHGSKKNVQKESE